MSVTVIASKKHRSIYLKHIKFINLIYETCKVYTKKNIDICIFDTNKFRMLKISHEFFSQIIKDRRCGKLYNSAIEMGNPSIISFLFNDKYGEVYCSISNILNNNNLKYKNINSDLLLYIAHSIANIYEIDNSMYNLIMSCVQRHNL